MKKDKKSKLIKTISKKNKKYFKLSIRQRMKRIRLCKGIQQTWKKIKKIRNLFVSIFLIKKIKTSRSKYLTNRNKTIRKESVDYSLQDNSK